MPTKNHALSCDAEGRMQRMMSEPWVWANPAAKEEPYAVLRWKGGALYAGPEESTRTMPRQLIDAGTMIVCSRADALRQAINGEVKA